MFSLYYPGAVITVNHYRGRRAAGGEYVKEEARLWMDALGWMIKASHVEEWRQPLHVCCSGRFLAKNRAPDLSNLSKCTLDAIQAVSGVNDRHMRWHDGDRVIDGSQAPAIFITIKEAPQGQGGDR